MKRLKLVELFQGLQSVKNLKGVKFSYGVAKNINILKPEIEALQKSVEMTEEFQKYEEERIALARNHAVKDEKGVAMMKDGSFVIADMDAWKKDFKEFNEPYKEVIAKRDEQIKEYNKLLEEEVAVELYKIKMEDVPQDITTGQLEGIFPVIEENGK